MLARSRRRSLLAALSTIVLLIGLSTVGAPASAIDGGDEKVAQLPWVAQLKVTDARGVTIRCTGSFLSERWIVTARHCLPSSSVPLSIDVSVMRDGWLEQVASATEHIDNPDLDVALVRVHSLSFPITSFAKLGNWVQNGSATAYGYGQTGPDESSPLADTLRSARVEIVGFERSWFTGALSMLARTGVQAPWARKLQVRGLNGTPRGGDSGGPLLQNGAVVGIYGQGGNLRDVRANPSYYASVTQVFSWISQGTGIQARDLDATSLQGTYTSLLSSANGFDLSVSGMHVVLDNGSAGSPFQIDFDGTWAFQLRSGSSCVSTADVVNEMTMLVVVRQILRMEPCDATDFTQKFYLAAQPPSPDGRPRGVVRTVVGEQAVSLLGTGEVGLTGLNDNAVLFTFGPSGTTSLSGLASALKTAGDVWATPRSIGKRDAPLLEARLIDANGQQAILPTLPAGVAVLDSALVSSNGSTAALLLGDDGKVYRSARSSDSTTFSPWARLPGDGVTTIASSADRGSFAYAAGTTVRVVDAVGIVRDFETPAGIGAVNVAVGASDSGDQVFVLGTDSRVYRYAADRSSSPSQLPGREISLLSVSDRAGGTVAYASARTVYLQRLDGTAGSRELPQGVNVAELSLSSAEGRDIATVASTDGSVRQMSTPAGGGAVSDIGVLVVVGADRGLTAVQAVPASAGQLMWTDGVTITTVGSRCAPPSLLPAGEVVNSVSTTVSATGILDYAAAGGGALYVSRNCQAWQRMFGAGSRPPAFTSNGSVLVLRALENRSGTGSGSEASPGGAIGTCKATE